MSSIRNWGAFIRGRWDWTWFGYERGFPRGCQFTDIDAALEFNNRRLLIECKSFDETDSGPFPSLPTGQRIFLEKEATDINRTVLIVYGCGVCNNPLGARNIGERTIHDWRSLPLVQRREELKALIDEAMGIAVEYGLGHRGVVDCEG